MIDYLGVSSNPSSCFRFIDSVTMADGEQVVIKKLFSGEHFLDYVDSIFFYLPFSSASESEAEAAKGMLPLSEWTKMRNILAADHRDPNNQAVPIQAWKDYVAKNFDQPGNSSGGVGKSSLFRVVRKDADIPPVPPPAPDPT